MPHSLGIGVVKNFLISLKSGGIFTGRGGAAVAEDSSPRLGARSSFPPLLGPSHRSSIDQNIEITKK
jgi:hypothetical protein